MLYFSLFFTKGEYSWFPATQAPLEVGFTWRKNKVPWEQILPPKTRPIDKGDKTFLSELPIIHMCPKDQTKCPRWHLRWKGWDARSQKDGQIVISEKVPCNLWHDVADSVLSQNPISLLDSKRGRMGIYSIQTCDRPIWNQGMRISWNACRMLRIRWQINSN